MSDLVNYAGLRLAVLKNQMGQDVTPLEPLARMFGLGLRAELRRLTARPTLCRLLGLYKTHGGKDCILVAALPLYLAQLDVDRLRAKQLDLAYGFILSWLESWLAAPVAIAPRPIAPAPLPPASPPPPPKPAKPDPAAALLAIVRTVLADIEKGAYAYPHRFEAWDWFQQEGASPSERQRVLWLRTGHVMQHLAARAERQGLAWAMSMVNGDRVLKRRLAAAGWLLMSTQQPSEPLHGERTINGQRVGHMVGMRLGQLPIDAVSA